MAAVVVDLGGVVKIIPQSKGEAQLFSGIFDRLKDHNIDIQKTAFILKKDGGLGATQLLLEPSGQVDKCD